MLLGTMSKAILGFAGEQNLLFSTSKDYLTLWWAKISLILKESQMALPH
jgi:hypothetical protein